MQYLSCYIVNSVILFLLIKELSMIEFKGELSKELKKIISRRLNTATYVALLLTSIVIALPLALIIKWPYSLGIIIGTAFMWIVFVIYGLIGKKAFPQRIYIEVEDEIITLDRGINSHYASLSDVKEVIDNGTWYDIKFYYCARKLNMDCICQKDLLTQGTIEQFEELFKDVLVRKS